MKATKFILVALLCLQASCAFGCYSGTKQIAKNTITTSEAATKSTSMSRETDSLSVKSRAGTAHINTEANAAKLDLANALQTGDVGPLATPLIKSADVHIDSILIESKAIDTNLLRIEALQKELVNLQGRILKDQASTQTVLPTVEDKTPFWAPLVKYGTYAAILIALCVVLWQTGLGLLIKKAVWALGVGLPSRTAAAKLDVEAVESGRVSAPQRERIAAQRASDPAYDAAFKKHKKQLNRKKK